MHNFWIFYLGGVVAYALRVFSDLMHPAIRDAYLKTRASVPAICFTLILECCFWLLFATYDVAQSITSNKNKPYNK